jgi:hypothetical protein
MSLPADIVLLSALFPFPPEPLPMERLNDFVPHLPTFETAITLTDYYFTHFAWWYNPCFLKMCKARISLTWLLVLIQYLALLSWLTFLPNAILGMHLRRL